METLVKSLMASSFFKTCFLAGILIKFFLFESSWSFSNLPMIMRSHQLHCNQAPRKGASSQRKYATIFGVYCVSERERLFLSPKPRTTRKATGLQPNKLVCPFIYLFCIRNNKWQTFEKVLEVFMARHWWHSSSSSCRVCSITVDTANKLGLFHLFRTPF